MHWGGGARALALRGDERARSARRRAGFYERMRMMEGRYDHN